MNKSEVKFAPSPSLFVGVFLLSSALLAFEIVATRITSVVYVYNYAFMIVSLAILGLGCGGIFIFYKWRYGELKEPNKNLSFYAAMFAVFVSLFIALVTESAISKNKLLYFSALFIPFFFAGAALSLAFRLFAKESFKLYAADLLGAAFGSILSILILNLLGGVNGTLFIGALGAMSSFALADFLQKNISYSKRAIIIALICIILFLGDLAFSIFKEVPIAANPNKELYNMLNEPASDTEIIKSEWSAFGRTDLAEYEGNDTVKHLFIDGAAGTPMYKFNKNVGIPQRHITASIMGFSNSFPFFFLKPHEKDNMLIIGPGGGREVLLGIFGGVKEITGVEVNPDFVNIVKEYRDYNGGIYTDFDNVHIVIDEGRSFVRGTDEQYDIIMITLPLTKTSRSFEGYALTENYLLTVESLKEYIGHLTDEGRMIVVLHNTSEILRFIMTSLVALNEEGISYNEAMNHIYVIGKGMMPLVVLKKKPFTLAEMEERHRLLQSMGPEATSFSYIPYEKELKAHYVPPSIPTEQKVEDAHAGHAEHMGHAEHIGGQEKETNEKAPLEHKGHAHHEVSAQEINIFNATIAELLKEKVELNDVIEHVATDISAARDDKPFFFKHEKGVTAEIRLILHVVIAVIISLIVLPMIFMKGRQNIINFLILFSLLGTGFMLIEISFFQKLTLYLGSPTISLAVLLGSLLSGMGAGSFYGRRLWSDSHTKRIKAVSFLIFISVIILSFAQKIILNNLLGADNIIFKSIVCSLFLIPLGFLLGIPFPSAINLMKDKNLERSIPWMYGINGIMSVLGSVSAIAISLTHGFSAALILGALCYLAIDLILM